MTSIEIYNAHANHIPNLINAYHGYQYQKGLGKSLESTLEHDQCIYEFTAHIYSHNKTTHEIQLEIDKICNNLQIHISKLLLGNNFAKKHKQNLQPAIIGCFDYENSKNSTMPYRCIYPHIHGILILNNKTKNNFLGLLEETIKERLILNNKPNIISQITFKQTYNGIEGLKKFTHYILKAEKINQRLGSDSGIPMIYSGNKAWVNYYKLIPENELRKYQ